MKRILMATAGLGAMFALAVPVFAQGGPGGPGGPGGGPGGPGGPHMERMCENRDARLAGMLAFAETKLKITQDQRAAWTKFTDTVKSSDTALDKICADEANSPRPTTLPQHVERMQQMMAAHLDQVQKVLPALNEVYAALTPEQKKTADEFMNHRGPGHGMGRGPM